MLAMSYVRSPRSGSKYNVLFLESNENTGTSILLKHASEKQILVWYSWTRLPKQRWLAAESRFFILYVLCACFW